MKLAAPRCDQLTTLQRLALAFEQAPARASPAVPEAVRLQPPQQAGWLAARPGRPNYGASWAALAGRRSLSTQNPGALPGVSQGLSSGVPLKYF